MFGCFTRRHFLHAATSGGAALCGWIPAAAHWLHGRNSADSQVLLQTRDALRKL